MLFVPDIALPVVDPTGAGLNQTFGWGCESGDSYGSGTSFDGKANGTLALPQSQPQLHLTCSERAPRARMLPLSVSLPPHLPAPHQQLFDTTYTDSEGTVYDGHSGW